MSSFYKNIKEIQKLNSKPFLIKYATEYLIYVLKTEVA